MRLNKRLLIAGRPFPLATDYVRLRLSEVGEGIFELLEAPPTLRRALLELYVSVGDSEEYLMFTGAVTDTRAMAQGRTRVDARELSAVLERTVILNMTHCTARDVVAKLEGATGLRFLLPAGADYLDERRLHFRSYGPGTNALAAASKVWEVPGAAWLMLPDGRMYWGNWARGPYSKAALPINSDLVLERDDAQRTATLPYIPALRPGMVVQVVERKYRIDGILFSGDTARVTWREL